MSSELIIVVYLIISVIVAKCLFYCEKYNRKRRGIYNWDDVDPTAYILLGFVWPLTLPSLVFIGCILVFITIIRLMFFRA